MAQAFASVRVLDFSQVIAGPFATQLFNMLGADVVKIEQPGVGDQMRTLMHVDDPDDPQMSPGFVSYNAGKKSLALDLKSADAREIIMRLAERSDVVVENFRAGVIDKLGFGYEAIRSVKPDIIYCSISGYGQTGPAAGRPAYDGAVQAASGMMAATGHPETGPTRTSYLPVDIATGITAAFAISSALYRKALTGEGQYIDVAMLDAAVTLQSVNFARYLAGAPEPQLLGNSSPAKLPTADSFETADGYILTSTVTEAQCSGLMKVVGLGHMLDDPRYEDNASRIVHADDVRRAVATAVKLKTSDQWIAALAEAKVPVSKVRNVAEVCADPQTATRNIIADAPVAAGHGVTAKVIGAAFTTNVDGPAVKNAPPKLGEQGQDVLRELGYSDAEIAKLDLG